MLARARSQEDGFGLIELLMSMVMLNIGILALVAAFQSGAFALQRASRISTAAAIADIQMERYRALLYCAVVFEQADVTAAQGDSTYTSDAEYVRAPTQITTANNTGCTGTTPPAESKPIKPIVGPDGKQYRADAYISFDSVSSSRQYKRVTIVVRDARKLNGRALARVASTFDRSTGETSP